MMHFSMIYTILEVEKGKTSGLFLFGHKFLKKQTII